MYRRFWVAGRDLDDWMWVPDGLEPPELEPGQYDPFPPVGFPLWTVTGYEPLRVGTPAGAPWLSLEAAHDEWRLIETFALWDRKHRRDERGPLVLRGVSTSGRLVLGGRLAAVSAGGSHLVRKGPATGIAQRMEGCT